VRAFLKPGVASLLHANLQVAFQIGRLALQRGGIGIAGSRGAGCASPASGGPPNHRLDGFLRLLANQHST
jgi:hypothetical protein